MEISKSNEKIKELKKLKNKGTNNLMVVEGLDVIKEAIINNMEIISVFYNDDNLKEEGSLLLKECKKNCNNLYKISMKTFESIREKENSVPIIAVIKFKEISLEDIDPSKHKVILVNDRIELPGNLGTIYRSAFASGIDLIINVDPVTTIYKEKFLASSRGCVFSIPTINTTYEKAQKVLLEKGYDICLCEPVNGTSYNEYKYTENTAIVVGNERFGINENWYENKNSKIYIPMKSGINSINVGVAASIIMFDVGIKKGKI